MSQPIRGRCTRITPNQIEIRWVNQSQGTPESRFQAVSVTPEECIRSGVRVGDLISWQDGRLQVLTPRRTEKPARWTDFLLDPRRLRGIKAREQVELGIREFFAQKGFLETRTPLLVPSPGMEPHIRPFHAASWGKNSDRVDTAPRFLPSSPEFAMKKLLVAGLERIFQICPAFRDEPHSVTHSPEFMILEWYRAYAGYEEIMRDTEELFAFLARRISGREKISYQGREISVATPWPRLRVRDLFLEMAGVDLVKAATREQLARECQRLGLLPSGADAGQDTWDDLYFRIWLNIIEPRLPSERAVFVTRYPASQAALSVIDTDPDGSRWARRFEVYAGGIELGNAFEELTDPQEQRRRFVSDMDFREKTYGEELLRSPLDEEFLEALAEGMPPSGGIAMGVDRMVMLFADESEIGYTTWLKSGAEQSLES